MRARSAFLFIAIAILLVRPSAGEAPAADEPEVDSESGKASEALSGREIYERYVEGRTRESFQGPLTSLLRFNPSRRTTLRTKVAYNTLFGEIHSGNGRDGNCGQSELLSTACRRCGDPLRLTLRIAVG